MLATFQAIDQRSRPALLQGTADLPTRLATAHLPEPLEPQAITMRAERDEEIVTQGEAAGYCYLIVSGCVRTVKLMEDGRRQVGEVLVLRRPVRLGGA